MPNLQIDSFSMETEQGVSVRYEYNSRDDVYESEGVQYPSAWTSEEHSCDEVERGEALSDHVVEGRKAGARAEADAYLEMLLRQYSEGEEVSEGFCTVDGELTTDQFRFLAEYNADSLL